jgi:hypothetical protein
LVTGTIEAETELVVLSVMVWVTTVVLVEFEGPTGDPSVDEVESVPLLGLLVKLTLTEVVVMVITLPVPNEEEEEEVEFDGPMGDPDVTEAEGLGTPQLPVP